MANAFENPDTVARVAAKLVGLDLNLGQYLYKDLAHDFSEGSGRIVSIRVPGSAAVSKRDVGDTTTPLAQGSINEQLIPVELKDHVYSSVPLSEEDLTLNIENYTSRVLVPQASSIARDIEATVAAGMQATPESTAITYDALTPAKTFTKIRAKLRENGVPTGARMIAAVGSGVYGDLLDAEAIDGNGKVRGFEIVESTRLAADEVIGFIPNAFALVVRAPLAPEGAPYSASVTHGGFALRVIRAYDPTVAVERSLVSSFVAVKPLPLPVDNEDGTVSLVANGGAVRVLTAA
ncbi:P22 phage major capsid protein family protein [Agromyces sp. H66]|uniref:P22 phage major capsid protein family protein n=1 Tax=Agromyces sp. H66 TaxID=2529859 RepID=UPI0010A9F2FA|nr:P22 phage major capsid protein family protein [Agromyces sp. H66]